MESVHGGGTNKHVELNPVGHNPSEPTMDCTISDLKLYPEAKHDDIDLAKKGSIVGLKKHPEAKQDDSKTSKECIGSRLSSSSSSSTSNDEGHDSFNKAKQDGAHSPGPGSLSSIDVSTQTLQWSMVSVSPRGGSGNLYSTDALSRTPEWIMFNSSAMKSPPIQAMGEGYDPNRIPSSVFSNKPATPMDWSVASNESLFSIHMGNNSFTRDSMILQGLDFTKPEEWSNSPLVPNNASVAKSRELTNFTPNLPPVAEEAAKCRTNVYVREGLGEELHETPKLVSGNTNKDHCKPMWAPDVEGVRLSTSSNLSDRRGVHRTSVSDPRVSNGSTQSCESFAFPVLINDVGKGGSSEVISEKPETTQTQPQDPTSTPTVATSNWFSCFMCWPPRCC